MRDKKYYMVRAMLSREEDFKIFFENNVVAVGWSRIDFSSFSDVDELKKAVRGAYYAQKDKAPHVISKNLNEVERFKQMKKGDRVIVPFYSYIVLAEMEDQEIYSKKAFPQDLSNQRRVSYWYENGKILKIPRNELSEGLQRRLRVRGNTVSDLLEFKEEIERIFQRKSYSYSQEMRDIEQKELEKLKSGLLHQIQNGKTNLQTGGIGLENLVCELMKCEGYEAEVLPKNKFTGQADADIRAIKKDSFMSKKIFVQVKHHSGYSGRHGIEQIINVLALKEYEEYDGCFITSAMVTDDARKLADKNGIEVMDGNRLVELIINNLDKLSETTKRLLGICVIPHMASIIK